MVKCFVSKLTRIIPTSTLLKAIFKMQQSTYRIKIIRFLIEINEFLFFYPKIRKFYNQLNKEGNFNVIFDVGTNKGQTIRVLKK